MINSEIQKVTGTPVDASMGNLTRSDNDASKRPPTVNLGMGEFSPRDGANTRGPYIVKGVEGYGMEYKK